MSSHLATPSGLSALIAERVTHKSRDFVREIDAVNATEARRYARSDWPTHRWGIGQNGSIAGIVYHVAAWKQMTLPLLGGGNAVPMQEFDAAAFPQADDWSGLVAWYKRVSTEWADAVALLADEDFARELPWEGMTITVTKLVLEIVDHDIQHASQIEYLRQRMRVGD